MDDGNFLRECNFGVRLGDTSTLRDSNLKFNSDSLSVANVGHSPALERLSGIHQLWRNFDTSPKIFS